MYAIYEILVLSISIKIIDSIYLEAESLYLKPKLERNNIVNKGVWIRSNKKVPDLLGKNSIGNFIFRANSLDVDNGVTNNFEGNVQETPYVSSYVQRTRRSPDHLRKGRPRKSMKTGKIIKSSVEDAVMIKSKLVTDLKPTSVFNEYPYEVAILLNNESDKITKPRKEDSKKETYKDSTDNKHTNNTHSPNTDTKEEIKIVSLNMNTSISSNTPKRSKKYDHIDEDIASNMVTDYNKTKTSTDINKQERNVFREKESKIWKRISPLTDKNFYKVVPKEPEKSKAVTERGLIKVISTLTKSFKKIMKQHSDIKSIHENLLNVSQNFDQKLAESTSKFEDFDSKYADMIQFNNKLKSFETELLAQKEYFDIKQKEIHDTFTDFQEQQKKFLVQQRQFYAIQKLMLSQNEKINAKQNLIAQTQSQISHRQNNFARILKKAKQIIKQNKSKINGSSVKQQGQYAGNVETVQTTVIPTTTISSSQNTESMKINLFAIPSKTNKLENQDALIIKEKDDKQIDDLVYKYYFNNTFIDALMKSKILNNYSTNSDSIKIVNRSKLSKNKRDDLEITIMLPVNNSLNDTPLKRERRWINHLRKNKVRTVNRHKKDSTEIILSSKDFNNIHIETKANNIRGENDFKNTDQIKSDPFLVMATSFCNGIGQNTNDQVLKWCVEKVLRRLKFVEINAFTPPPYTFTPPIVTRELPPTPELTTLINNNVKSGEEISALGAVLPAIMSESQPSTTLGPVSKITPLYVVSSPAQAIFFPDNDELESNLKQYELKPDTEGNVYYDGSVHISDYGRLLADNSADASDIMPGLMDSNSRVEIDPLTFDIQAKRRAYVRRMNENILHQIKGERQR